MVRVLQDAGYLVAAARNGQEGIGIAEQQSALDLLITDVAMRGINGLELARLLVEQRPNLKVIVTSSYRPAQLDDESVGFTAVFIEKPWAPGELVDCVATVLAHG